MTNQKVNIVIPYYNGDSYIKHLLDSIKIQIYNNISIIIVNDGSRLDSTLYLEQILKDYSTLNINYIKQSNHGGICTVLFK